MSMQDPMAPTGAVDVVIPADLVELIEDEVRTLFECAADDLGIVAGRSDDEAIEAARRRMNELLNVRSFLRTQALSIPRARAWPGLLPLIESAITWQARWFGHDRPAHIDQVPDFIDRLQRLMEIRAQLMAGTAR